MGNPIQFQRSVEREGYQAMLFPKRTIGRRDPSRYKNFQTNPRIERVGDESCPSTAFILLQSPRGLLAEAWSVTRKKNADSALPGA